MASGSGPCLPLYPQTDSSPPSPADCSIGTALPSTLASRMSALHPVGEKAASLASLFEGCDDGCPAASSSPSANATGATLDGHVQSVMAEMLDMVCGDSADSGAVVVPDEQHRDDLPSRAVRAHDAAAAAAMMPMYDAMLQHIQRKDPPIVGIRFELLLDGMPLPVPRCFFVTLWQERRIILVRSASRSCTLWWFGKWKSGTGMLLPNYLS
jgi:hypothetical protein